MKDNRCFLPADILVPKTPLEKWSVIACDQYTSEPEYWERVKENAGESPSALNIILPEFCLKDDNSDEIKNINSNMQRYLDLGIFEEYKDAMIYVERLQSDGRLRCGIVGKTDLLQYSYKTGEKAAVKATEQTVISRIPPRVEIRKNAPLELPHIMLLVDDDEKTVVEPLKNKKDGFKKLYDFDLMCGAGHITGYLIDPETVSSVQSAIDRLKSKHDGLIFCVGDGNHSLAAAKECYNLNKSELSRYALTEVVNIHSPAIEFEPIYRIVFGTDPEKLINDFVDYCGGEYNGEDSQKFTCYYSNGSREVSVKPIFKLSVATLQSFLDGYLENAVGTYIDYIHGEDSLKKLANTKDAVGFVFEGMRKEELFPAVLKDGSLPRKTFSMGRADDKRFYIEARKIK